MSAPPSPFRGLLRGVSSLVLFAFSTACSIYDASLLAEATGLEDEQAPTADGVDEFASTGGGPGSGVSLGSGGDSFDTGGSASADLGTGGEEGTGGSAMLLPETTMLDGVIYEPIGCGAPLPDGARLFFGGESDDYSGWSHPNKPELYAAYAGLRSDDRSVYNFTDQTKAVEPECGGEFTLRRTLLRKIYEHEQRHSNGFQVFGSYPDLFSIESIVIDLKLESEGSHLPAIDPIYDGKATVKILTVGTSIAPFFRIDPELYLDQWIRITIPAAKFGTGAPTRLQFVAELTEEDAIDESFVDIVELDLNIHRIALVMR